MPMASRVALFAASRRRGLALGVGLAALIRNVGARAAEAVDGLAERAGDAIQTVMTAAVESNAAPPAPQPEAPDVTTRMAYLALQVGVIILAAKFGALAARRFKLPPVLGELAAGMAVGPFGLGGKIPLPFLHAPEGQTLHVLFPDWLASGAGMPVSTELYGVATIGSILLLFISGLETDLKQFIRYAVAGSVVGLGGVVASFAAGALAGWYFIPDIPPELGLMDPRCLFLGVLSTATSVGITARILSEKKKMDSPEGVTIMAGAVMDDVLGIIGLAIVLNLTKNAASASGETAVQWGQIGLTTVRAFGVWIGAMAFGLIFADHIARFLKLFHGPVGFASAAAALALIAGGLIEQAGLAMIIGAYVLGLSLSKTDIAFALEECLQGFYALFVPLFFAVMGMLVDLESFLNPAVLKFGLAFSAAAIAAKVVGCGLPALFLDFNFHGALRIGTGMVPRGEVALIIAGIGATKLMTHTDGHVTPILDAEHFGAAIIMTVLTTLVAPPLLSAVMGGSRSGVRRAPPTPEVVDTPFQLPTARVTELVFDKLVSLYRTEGYFVSRIHGETEYRMAKERSSFTLARQDTTLAFRSLPDELPFIRFSLSEAVADLKQSLEFLHQVVAPEPLWEAAAAEQRGSPSGRRVVTDLPASASGRLRPAAASTPAPSPSATPPAPSASLSKAKAATVPAPLSGGGKNESSIRPALPTLAAYFGTVLTPECVSMRLKAATREEAIHELVDLLAAHGRLLDPARVLEAVHEREQASPTGLERGVALPHARTDATKQTVAAVGIAPEGLDFGARDGQPSQLIVLLVSPRTSTGPHLAFLTALALRLKQIEDLTPLLRAETSMDLLQRLTGGEPVKSHHRIWERLHGGDAR